MLVCGWDELGCRRVESEASLTVLIVLLLELGRLEMDTDEDIKDPLELPVRATLSETVLNTCASVADGKRGGWEGTSVDLILLFGDDGIGRTLLLVKTPSDDNDAIEVDSSWLCSTLPWFVMVLGYVSVTVGVREGISVALPMFTVIFGTVAGINVWLAEAAGKTVFSTT